MGDTSYVAVDKVITQGGDGELARHLLPVHFGQQHDEFSLFVEKDLGSGEDGAKSVTGHKNEILSASAAGEVFSKEGPDGISPGRGDAHKAMAMADTDPIPDLLLFQSIERGWPCVPILNTGQ